MRSIVIASASLLLVVACSTDSDPNDSGGGTGGTGGTGATSTCPRNQVECDGTCVDLDTSAANCGACGNACETGMVCAAGECACGAGQTDCDGACVNTERDAEHCGGCDVACAANEVCSAGDCTSGCPAGFEECDRACTDVLTDAEHCGACGRACPAEFSCVDGECACPDGLDACGEACVDLTSDAVNCGDCGVRCAPGETCDAGECAGAETGSGGGGGEAGGAGGDAAGGTSPGAGGAGGDAAGGTSPGAGGSPVFAGGGPPAGNPDGTCAVPAEAGAEDTSAPDQVIGDGTAESCTSSAVVEAVAQGGIITFDCGPDPVTIVLDETAKIFNDTGPEIVIDGGGLVTLSGGGERRILYMNTCDEAQVWTTPNCDNQDHPRLTLQNLTFVDGNSTDDDDEGGGAVFSQGGRLKIVNSRFFNNVCDPEGPDLGGAGVRAFMQYEGLPLYVVNSTFGGAEGYGNECANGGGVSSIGVSWTIINSLFSYNRAIGNGGNPADAGTPGGGSGGAIYNDGNTMTLTLCGTRIERNEVNAYGSAIFFVSNDHSGDIVIDQSVITGNLGGSWYELAPQISGHADTRITITDSVIE